MRAWMEWPVYRQLTGTDRLGRGEAVASGRTRELRPRVADADKVVVTRFGVFEAGRASAADPKFTIGPQRDRILAREDHR